MKTIESWDMQMILKVVQVGKYQYRLKWAEHPDWSWVFEEIKFENLYNKVECP